ncbi:hypothetical protein [Actinomadura sp. CNU-125]|uniref:hypothetical protein n=1 Tax=Actinomadura sp. CNU-125 TaxID=1904961 RepID=UPI001300D2DE|nr:hypothetical protein [Actinomadura sp. CNU-125]
MINQQPAAKAPAAARTSTVRTGYARVSGRVQDHRMRLDAPRGRGLPRAVLDAPKPGDTPVIYKPDRIARSMKEPLVLLGDELHAREVDPEIGRARRTAFVARYLRERASQRPRAPGRLGRTEWRPAHPGLTPLFWPHVRQYGEVRLDLRGVSQRSALHRSEILRHVVSSGSPRHLRKDRRP